MALAAEARAVRVPMEQYLLLSGVTWDFYEQMLKAVEGTNLRVTFLDGEIEVLKKSRRGRETRVAILGPNDCFGEMSIIDMQPRSATVRALGPARLLRITTEEMDQLYRHDLKSYTLIVLNIARDLSRRLRVTDGLLADFTATVIEEYVQTPSSSKR